MIIELQLASQPCGLHRKSMKAFITVIILLLSSLVYSDSTVFDSNETPRVGYWQISYDSGYYYGGMYGWSFPSNKTISQLDLNLYYVDGDVTGKTFVVKLWTYTGSTLDSAVATSDGVSGASITATPGWISFPFSTTYGYTANTPLAVTIGYGGEDSTNYARLSFTDGKWTKTRWDSGGIAQGQVADMSLMYRFYENTASGSSGQHRNQVLARRRHQ
jgi:hypothetical protein